MKRPILCTLLFLGFAVAELAAQNLTAAALASPAKAPRKPAAEKAAEKDPIKAAMGGGKPAVVPGEPITTEIYADEAFFDSAKSIGIFTGRVIVKDPRFNVQSDKMTIFLTKGASPGAVPAPKPETTDPASAVPTQALEKAVAEGNVGVVREQLGEDGAPPTRSIGRADTAIYTTVDGNVELRGNPRVQSGMNTHVATSPDTVMVISQDGKLTTRGPSRTEIRQEPNASPSPKPAATPKP